MTSTLPAIFFGHGSPMNAIGVNRYSAAWKEIGRQLPKPRAVLMVSAHWFVDASDVTISAQPRTIHDFTGFPDELYQVQYPAPGEPALARQVRDLLAPLEVSLDAEWGLDHGTWAVLRHVFPDADVPVVQLSINASRPPDFHYRLGQALAPLRAEGVLLAGSGNVVHNLKLLDRSGKSVAPYDWAQRFNQKVRDLVTAGDHDSLIDFEQLGEDALLSIPTPEHYLPLLYVLGSRNANDALSFPVDGMAGGSISMLTMQLG